MSGRSRRGTISILVLLTLAVALCAGVPCAGAAGTGLETLEKQVREFTLPNGLRFIVVERHGAPVFSYQIVVNSGSADDRLGATGLAHMMEHMAFKGTSVVGTRNWPAEKAALDGVEAAWNALHAEQRKRAAADTTTLARLRAAFAAAQEKAQSFVVPNEADQILESSGAQNVNASTSDDVTRYFYSIPSNRIELWALMEGARMTRPVFREFYQERDVVYEERRMRTESSPVGRLIDEFVHAAYVAHPYSFGGIGFPSDLRSFSRVEGEEFYRRHYVARNMTVTVVGDVTVEALRPLAERYFGEVSSGPPPPPIEVVEPEQRAERRVILEDAAQPMLAVAWHIPAVTDPSYAACEALVDLLAGGDYARLNKVLVKEKKVAVQVQGFTGFPGEKYPNLMGFFVVPAAGQDPVKVEAALDAVLAQVQTRAPITAEELHGYQVRERADRIRGVESNDQLAEGLATAQTLHGDWREFFREQERIQALTVGDLMNVMTEHMVRRNRTVGMIVNPKPAAAPRAGR